MTPLNVSWKCNLLTIRGTLKQIRTLDTFSLLLKQTIVYYCVHKHKNKPILLMRRVVNCIMCRNTLRVRARVCQTVFHLLFIEPSLYQLATSPLSCSLLNSNLQINFKISACRSATAILANQTRTSERLDVTLAKVRSISKCACVFEGANEGM